MNDKQLHLQLDNPNWGHELTYKQNPGLDPEDFWSFVNIKFVPHAPAQGRRNEKVGGVEILVQDERAVEALGFAGAEKLYEWLETAAGDLARQLAAWAAERSGASLTIDHYDEVGD